MRRSPVVRATTLVFAVGLLGALVFHASATTGCAGTQAPANAPSSQAAASDPANAPPPSAEPERYLPATKAGPMFVPSKSAPARKAHVPSDSPP